MPPSEYTPLWPALRQSRGITRSRPPRPAGRIAAAISSALSSAAALTEQIPKRPPGARIPLPSLYRRAMPLAERSLRTEIDPDAAGIKRGADYRPAVMTACLVVIGGRRLLISAKRHSHLQGTPHGPHLPRHHRLSAAAAPGRDRSIRDQDRRSYAARAHRRFLGRTIDKASATRRARRYLGTRTMVKST
jgi:hypothetical protein